MPRRTRTGASNPISESTRSPKAPASVQSSPVGRAKLKRETGEPPKGLVPSSPRRSKRLKTEASQPAGSSVLAKDKGSVIEEKHSVIKIEEGFQEYTSQTGFVVAHEADPTLKTSVDLKLQKNKTKKERVAETMMPLAVRGQGLRMFVGAHVSAAKGVFNAVSNSTYIGGNAFALFLKSQRKWDNPPLQDDHRDQFRKFCAEHKYDAAKHVLPHGSYLVNLAQEEKAKAKQAYDSFLDDLRRCEALGITLYNFHPGSATQSSRAVALTCLAKALINALEATSSVVPVLETMCGHGTTIGGYLEDFRDLLALIPPEHHSRIGICIDTCHSHAAGYDLVTPDGFRAFLQEFDDLIGLKYLRALHLNDSRAPRGSKRDLHANIGTGFLGLRAFHNVMNEPRFEGLPMILETPIDRPRNAIPAGPQSGRGDVVNAAFGCRYVAEKDVDKADTEEDKLSKESSDPEVAKKKSRKKTTKRPATATPATVADLSVWAHEIKLLESLIGMDSQSDEFKDLEAQLAEEGGPCARSTRLNMSGN